MAWPKPACSRSRSALQTARDYEGAHEQCLRLLTLARILGRQGIVRQHEFGPFPMLLSALDQKAVSAFTDEVLGRLELYDQANGTDMLRTASAFIDQGCRFQSTAEFLRIHNSTLRYRLQRIEELFGLDLEDAEQRFSLSFAVRLAHLCATGLILTRCEAYLTRRK
jgi:DNA-binding PucR family transcriptional regulator